MFIVTISVIKYSKSALAPSNFANSFLESFEAFHALRRGMVKLRLLVPKYRPTRASVHETARAIVEAMDVLGTQLKRAA
jgi:hypothetical protein